MSLGPLEAAAVSDVRPIQNDMTQVLARKYGVLVWFGHHTREWWALVDGRVLVGARCPERLGRAIASVRRQGASGSP